MPKEHLPVRKIREVLRLKSEGFSNRAIARVCQVSNSTVGEYLEKAKQAGLSWPLPEGMGEETLYQSLFLGKGTSSQPVALRAPDWEEVHRELAKRGVSLRLLWQEYREKNPNGYGKTQFGEHYQRWNQAHTNTMRLPHKGGEEMEVDYAGMTLPITNPETGEISQAQVFVAVLPASSYTYAEIQPSQELRYWLGGHVRGFEFFGGVPKILRPDNLKSGVKTPNRYEPELNPSYQELAEHYQIAVLPARVRRPKDKATVENSVQNVERWVLAPLRHRTFFSLGEANRAIAPLLAALNQKEMQHLGKSRLELYEELDRPALRPLPERPYEFAIWKNAKVSIDYHIVFEGHYYSVPHTLVRQEVRIRASESMLQIFHHGTQAALHARSRTQGRFSTRAEHMPANHRFVLNADGNWFQQEADKIGPQTSAYFTVLLKSRPYPQQAYRTCLGILDLARKHSHARLEIVCERLLPAHLLSYKDVKAELERLAANLPAEPLPVHENVRGQSYYREKEPIMSVQVLYDQLIELRLPTFLEALREQQANPQYTELTFEDRLALLTDHECIRRRESRIQRNIKSAAFPMQAAFEDIDFSPARSLDRRAILELGQCNWITSRHNLLVLGPTGSGKSFIASAFGNIAARHGFTVRYQRTSRLLHALTLARADGSFTALLRSLAKINLLIIDDWMRDPITLSNAQDILEVLDDRFGHTATLIASQVPVSDWHLRIPDPTLADAILDRLVHNAQRIELKGESQRKLRAGRSISHT